MKYLYSLIITLLIFGTANSQTSVVPDPGLTWGGYVSWFENNSGAKGGYLGGGDWGLADVKTTITAAGDNTYADGALTLQPNFNTYADNVNGDAAAQAFWTDGAGGGNKWLEATSKVDYAGAGVFTDGALTFNGTVASNTLDSNYSVVAFIKTLDPNAGYATIINEYVTLGATGTTFAVSANGINQAHIVQIGFTMEGLNANPDNEAALGSIIVTPTDFGGGDNGGDDEDCPAGSTTYCDTEVTHFNIEAETASKILLTIEKTGADKITISASSAGESPIDKLFVGANASGGATTATDITSGVASFDMTWAAGTMPATATFELLWSTEASGGNWMLQSGDGTQGIGNVCTTNVCATASFRDISFYNIDLYPNPASNVINVRSESTIDNFSVLDLMGRTVKQQISNNKEFSLDVSDLPKGIYLVKLSSGEKEAVTKFIKE